MNGFTIPTTCPRRKQAKSSTLKIGSVTVVTSEQLISPISGQSHCDMLTSQAADMIRRDDGRIAKRFFQRTRQRVYGFLDVRLDDHFMMLGAEPSCDQAGIFGFVEVLAGEANRKCFDWARTGASHECNHSGGVNPSAQQRSERDIAEQPNPDSLSKPIFQFFQTFFLGSRLVDAVRGQVPVLVEADLAADEFKHVSRRQLVDSREGSLRIGNVTEVEVTEQGLWVNLGKLRCGSQ